MLNDVDIKFITYADKHSYRKWKLTEIRYDFENGSYCSHQLNEQESITFGTPYDAYTHAKYVLRKYKKKYNDAIIVIKEVNFKK